MISCLINYFLSLTNFEDHITNNDFLDAMFVAPGLIGIYVRFLFDMQVTASIYVQGARYDLVEQFVLDIWTFFVCNLPFLEEEWSVGWVKKTIY